MDEKEGVAGFARRNPFALALGVFFRYLTVLLLTFLLLSVAEAQAQSGSQTFTSSGTFTVPSGITKITVQAWGGGGRGGSATRNNSENGGGGGGAYASSIIDVTPGSTYTVTVGGGSNSTSPGGDSWFGTTSTLLAKGGNSAGNDDSNGATGGAASSCIGSICLSGGNGANGSGSGGSVVGGGGGSSAGYSSNGDNGYGTAGGTAPSGGGDGGDGATTNNNGTPGSSPGGGGGGGARQNSNGLGGAGASGQVIVSWSTLPYVNFANAFTNVAESGGTFTVLLSMSSTSSSNVTVNYSVSGSAIENTDYTIESSPVTIPAGSSSAAIEISVTDDTSTENDETIIITINSVTNAAIGIPAQHTVTIIDNDFVDPSLDVSPSTVCQGNSVTFTADPPSGSCADIQRYESSPDLTNWTDITSSMTITGCDATYTPPSTGTLFYRYYYYRNPPNSGYSNTAAVTVNTTPDTPGEISGSASVVAGQTDVSYSVAAVSGATSYTWSYTGSGATINGSGNNITIDFSGSATSGDLTVYATNSCGNSGTSNAFSISVSLPSPTISGFDPTSACYGSGSTVTITGTNFTGVTDVSFNSVSASYTVNSSTEIDATLPATATTGTISVTTSSGTATSSSSFTVNPLPTNTYTMDDVALCHNSSTSLTLSGSESGVDYQLRDNSDDSNVGSAVSGTGSSISFTNLAPDDTTTYNVLATNATTGCEAEMTDLATINVLFFNAAAWNITGLTGSDSTDLEPASRPDICPELNPPDFNPDDDNYDCGASFVDFRIDRDSSLANWQFDFTITGATVLDTIATGDVSTPSLAGGTVDAGNNNKVYLRFKIDNVTETTLSISFNADNVQDTDNSCNETGNFDDNDAYQTINPMPEVGPFE
ncbi:MAG: IPT/TIG domain-containing protein [Prolixibacteraceae bacterium]|nr:IPT/TIG domain-containing protein [Prolixibacteraceae bacterium]